MRFPKRLRSDAGPLRRSLPPRSSPLRRPLRCPAQSPVAQLAEHSAVNRGLLVRVQPGELIARHSGRSAVLGPSRGPNMVRLPRRTSKRTRCSDGEDPGALSDRDWLALRQGARGEDREAGYFLCGGAGANPSEEAVRARRERPTGATGAESTAATPTDRIAVECEHGALNRLHRPAPPRGAYAGLTQALPARRPATRRSTNERDVGGL